jgi:hypothetical protein
MRIMSRHRSVSRAGMAVAAFVSLLAATSAQAQSGRVTGVVKGPDGRPLRGVTVVAGNPDAAPPIRSAVTDEKGRFVIVALRSGAWVFTASLTGHLPAAAAARVTGFNTTGGIELRLARDPDYRAPAMDGVNVKDLQSQLTAADLLVEQGRDAEAAAAYQALLVRLPALTTLHLQIGRAHRRAGDPGRAADAFAKALEGGVGRHVVLPEMALARLDLGDVIGARAALGLLDDREASLGAALYVRGVVSAREGDPIAARSCLEQFLALEPDAPESGAARKLLGELARQ